MIPSEEFKAIVGEIATAAKLRGYRRKRQIFRCVAGDIIGVFSVDRSKWNTADEIEFRFSTDIIHSRLHEIYHGEPFEAKSCRPGYGVAGETIFREVNGEKRSFPWRLHKDADLPFIGCDVQDALENVVFPQIEDRMDDEGLCRALWKTLQARKGAVYLSQRICLICLLHESGQQARLEEVMRATMLRLSQPGPDGLQQRIIERLAKVGIDAQEYA